jgi:hypothetical protein
MLKCPRCGIGPMFGGLFHMHERCAHCRLKFEREPGYFLGSIYINYGVSALLTIAGWITLRYMIGVESRAVVGWILGTFCVVFGALFFRYARALWLAMDCQFDRSIFTDRQ